MTALSASRNTPRLEQGVYTFGLAANARIFQGGLTCLDATGHVVKGSTALGLVAVGRAEVSVDNTGGAAGEKMAPVRPGTYRWANSAAADLITIAERSRTAYIVDDQTVARTDGGGTRSSAGIIVDVDARGVWVRSGF